MLESEMSNVVNDYKNEKTYQEIESELALNQENIELEIKNENNEILTFFLKKEVTIVTPGLTMLFPKPYFVTVKRSVNYE